MSYFEGADVIPVTPENGPYPSILVQDPNNHSSRAVLTTAGGSVLSLNLSGQIVQPHNFLPTTLTDGNKGVVRLTGHVMVPQSGSGANVIDTAFAEEFKDRTSINPKAIEVPKHGFVSALVHDKNLQSRPGYASCELHFGGCKSFPFKFNGVSEVYFGKDGFERWYTVVNTNNKTIPMSIGFHTFRHIPGGDAGIDKTTIYDANGKVLYDLSNYELTEADQKEMPLPATYYIQTPRYLLEVTNLGDFQNNSVLNIWTDTAKWQGSSQEATRGEWYTKEMIDMIIAQNEERYGMKYSDQQKIIIVRHFQNSRYICDEPVKPGFNALRTAPGPVYLKTNETLSVGQRLKIVEIY